MEMKFLLIVLTALIPLVVGMVWYHPKVLGTMWMHSAGLTEESLKDFNMLKVFGLTYILSLMLTVILHPWVIHQFGVYSLVMNEPGFGEAGSEVMNNVEMMMSAYGDNFRTFGHGALHGLLASLFIVLPVIAVNAMFERRSFRYIAINTGFWALCLALMGGVICAMG